MLGIDKNYILYISRIEHPGKNHLKLMMAYEKSPVDIKSRYCLVMPGKFWKGSDPVRDYAAASNDTGNFVFPGFIPNDQLPDLYRASSMYIFPSYFEGFGISLAEAMACGVPCACSNCSSLPEVGGDAVLTFDPENVDEMAATMQRILTDDALRNDLIEKGFERLPLFDWKKHAEDVVEVYEKFKEK